MLGQDIISLATEFNLDCLELILEHAEDILANNDDIKDSFGRTALHLAAANAEPSAVKLLVRKGFKGFLVQDQLGYTPLQIACMKGILLNYFINTPK